MKDILMKDKVILTCTIGLFVLLGVIVVGDFYISLKENKGPDDNVIGIFLATKRKKTATVNMQPGMSKLQKIKIIVARMVAVFVANGLAVIGAGSLIGVDTVSSILLAGSLGVIKVSEALARAYIDDGKVTLDEINESFAIMEKKK